MYVHKHRIAVWGPSFRFFPDQSLSPGAYSVAAVAVALFHDISAAVVPAVELVALVMAVAHRDLGFEVAAIELHFLRQYSVGSAHLGRPCIHIAPRSRGTGMPAEAAGMRGCHWWELDQTTVGLLSATTPMDRCHRDDPDRAHYSP